MRPRDDAAGAAEAAPGPAAPSLGRDELLARLGTSIDGLRDDEARARSGPDVRRSARAARAADAARALARPFTDPLLLLLLGAAVLSAFLDQALDAAIIVVIVLLSGALGAAQSYRSQRAVARLQSLVPVHVDVRRAGRVRSVPIGEVVVGDVVELELGDLVPGDGRLLTAVDLTVDESALTGEPFPRHKVALPATADGARGDGADVVRQGSHVVGGTGAMVVEAVGVATLLGRTARAARVRTGRTSFEQGVVRFGRTLTGVGAVIALATVVMGALLGRPLLDAVLFALALAVGLAPELLPAILAVSLSAGAHRMADRRVVVRRLDAIEDFGGMTVLCTDKTGTLTAGRVALAGAHAVSGEPDPSVARLAAANARAHGAVHDPIDAAILAGQGGAVDGVEVLGCVPFDFTRKRVGAHVVMDGVPILVVKGALEAVLAVSVTALVGGRSVPLADVAAEVHRAHAAWAARGMRVVGVATRDLDAGRPVGADDETGLCLRGVLVLADPLKDGAAASVAHLAEAGIGLVMLTGDDRRAATHVADAVGIPAVEVLAGTDVRAMDDTVLRAAVGTTRVFAELDPTDKARVVAALRARGEVVGMLGDGVNDVAAMRRADVAISVDTATPVAKDAADLVLLDRDLDVLLEGIRLGRQTFANTLKYVMTTVTANLGNVVSVAIATAFLPFLPMLPRQILLLNLLSDVPSLAIAGDRVDPEELGRPQRWDVRGIRDATIVFGLLSSAFDLMMFAALVQVFTADAGEFRTAWFVGSVLTELVVLFVFRTRRGALRSRPSVGIVVTSVVVALVTVALVSVPAVRPALGFAALPAPVLAAVAGLALAYAVVTEVVKARRRRWAHAPTGVAGPVRA